MMGVAQVDGGADCIKAAIVAALGDQTGCSSERCCCYGAEEVFECKMCVSVDALAAAIAKAIQR